MRALFLIWCTISSVRTYLNTDDRTSRDNFKILSHIFQRHYLSFAGIIEGEQAVRALAVHFEEAEPLVEPDGQCRAVLKLQTERPGMGHHFFVHEDDLGCPQLVQQSSDSFVAL